MTTITIDRDLLEQALDALEIEQGAHAYLQLGKAEHIEEAITALRSALSEEALQRLTDIHQEMEQSRLTDEEIVELWTDIALQDNGSGWHAIGKRFARAIEDRIRSKT